MANSRYSLHNRLVASQHACTSSAVTQVSVTSGATPNITRGQIVDIEVGQDGLPVASDCSVFWDVVRQTTLGTGSATTPNAIDPTSVASRGVGTTNYTVEPTITAASGIWAISLNQRASFRWWAAPGSELIYPSTTLNGLALRALSATYTNNLAATVFFDDL